MLEIINIDINKLKPYKNNPRKNDEAVEYVANSIKEFGFKVPIIVDKDYEIIAGHTRLKAAQQLGLKEVPIIIADDLTEEQVKAFRLVDNKVSENAYWDFDLLSEELKNIGLDMTQFSFNKILEEPLLTELEELDYDKKEYLIKIKFDKPEDFKRIEDELREYIDKLNANSVSVSGGYI